MTTDFMTAAQALADVLREENAALEALDLAAATAMLPAKQLATTEFTKARDGLLPEPQEAAALMQELQQLADQNRKLLERGMVVQGRLIGLMARAASESAASELEAYSADGAPRAAARMPAIALAARV